MESDRQKMEREKEERERERRQTYKQIDRDIHRDRMSLAANSQG